MRCTECGLAAEFEIVNGEDHQFLCVPDFSAVLYDLVTSNDQVIFSNGDIQKGVKGFIWWHRLPSLVEAIRK